MSRRLQGTCVERDVEAVHISKECQYAKVPKCMEHVMYLAGKALRNFWYMLNKEFL
jgi:hypothetical protein